MIHLEYLIVPDRQCACMGPEDHVLIIDDFPVHQRLTCARQTER